MRIVKLEIEDDALLSGVDAVALVETPAHEQDFYAFKKETFESYTDYPESAVNAAKRALEWRDSHPENDCGTAVGWARANQLAKREPISEETIARMASFARHLQYEDVPYSEGCGGLMVDAWGGRAGIEWASNKLSEIREDFVCYSCGDTGGWADGVASGLTDWLGEGPKYINIWSAAEGNMDILGYQTQHFEICPGAISLFTHLLEMPISEENRGMIRSAAVLADQVFLLEKKVLAKDAATPEELVQAIALVQDFRDIIHEIDEDTGMVHDTAFMDGHIDIIAGKLPQEELMSYLEEGPDTGENVETNYIDTLAPEIQDAIINVLERVGENESDYDEYTQVSAEEFHKELFALLSTPNKESILDVGDTKIRYRYSGPRDGKNRKFCAKLMSLTDRGKIFRKEDINQMTITTENEQFGTYDIFTYKGSYNCRHSWEALYFRKAGDQGVKEGERPAAIGDLLSSGVNKPVIADPSRGIQDKLEFARQALAEEQKVIGPLMRANKLILRVDESGDPYYVYFTPSTIKRIADKFMKEGRLKSFNIEHDSNQSLDDVYITEAWLVEDPENDKSTLYGFQPNKGDWYGISKFSGKRLWNEYIKTGRVKGYSVEGFFLDEMFRQKETFVEPGLIESKDEFIGRCIPYMIGEGYNESQSAAICYTKWDNR